MRNIRYAQHDITQHCFDLGVLLGEGFFAVTEGSALRHQAVGILLLTPQGSHLFGELVHSGACSIALSGDIAQSCIEPYRMVGLLE